MPVAVTLHFNLGDPWALIKEMLVSGCVTLMQFCPT